MKTRREQIIKALEEYTQKEGVAFMSVQDGVDYYTGLIELLNDLPPRCTCENVDFGTYERTVIMKYPFGERHHGLVTIDICIARDIAELWKEGIKTTGSCCGHDKLAPTVCIEEESIPKIRELGYEQAYGEENPQGLTTVFYL